MNGLNYRKENIQKKLLTKMVFKMRIKKSTPSRIGVNQPPILHGPRNERGPGTERKEGKNQPGQGDSQRGGNGQWEEEEVVEAKQADA